MAGNLQPPKGLSFAGNASENFKIFEQQYTLYVAAVGLANAPNQRRTLQVKKL